MHIVPELAARDSRLRFVFPNKVVAFRVADDVSLGEIASRFGEISGSPRRKPIAVDVTVGWHQDSQHHR